MDRLTSKQQKFVDAYVKTGNATQAAIDAGYSVKTARSIASENLTKPPILRALKAAQATQVEDVQTKGFEYLEHLREVCEVSICSMYDSNHKLRHPALWDPKVCSIIKAFEVRSRKNGTLVVKVKFIDRFKVLQMIGHAVGAFVPSSYRRR